MYAASHNTMNKYISIISIYTHIYTHSTMEDKNEKIYFYKTAFHIYEENDKKNRRKYKIDFYFNY
jgi:hypothetical protein